MWAASTTPNLLDEMIDELDETTDTPATCLLDHVLAEAWRRGTVLAGLSAGSLCWFSEAVTMYNQSRPPAPIDGIGLLPYSNCVHVDAEPPLRPVTGS
mgnify:CR=1 FL=1